MSGYRNNLQAVDTGANQGEHNHVVQETGAINLSWSGTCTAVSISAPFASLDGPLHKL